MKKTVDELVAKAKKAIENKEQFVFDIADNNGQIVDNVKHMTWFIDAVADQITLDVKAYKHLHID